eukprot:1623804-Pyramimonas_sp.AAC.1
MGRSGESPRRARRLPVAVDQASQQHLQGDADAPQEARREGIFLSLDYNWVGRRVYSFPLTTIGWAAGIFLSLVCEWRGRR